MTHSEKRRRQLARSATIMAAAMLSAVLAAGCSSSPSSSSSAAGASQSASPASSASVASLSKPTKALCKKSSYKIGYDVFSGSQPFANLVTQAIMNNAKQLGCVTVIKTVDDTNGPQAVANLKTMTGEGIQGFIDFQILEPFQPAIATQLKKSNIPGVAIIGANLPGWPGVGADNYGATFKAGAYLANVAKQRYPGQVPYLVASAEPVSGAEFMQRYYGDVAGVKSVYPSLPASHVITVNEDGSATTAYNNTISALSSVPSNAVVLIGGSNDEVVGGMAKAAQARGLKNYLVNSFGGDSYGLSQVCTDQHYVGALYLEPKVWGADALSVILNEINGVKVPSTVGVLGEEVTSSTPVTGCKG